MKVVSYRKHQFSPPSAFWTGWRETICGGLGAPRCMTLSPNGKHHANQPARTGFRTHPERAFTTKDAAEING